MGDGGVVAEGGHGHGSASVCAVGVVVKGVVAFIVEQGRVCRGAGVVVQLPTPTHVGEGRCAVKLQLVLAADEVGDGGGAAQGVEDEDAICVAMRSNINLFQGYYFCRPTYNLDMFVVDEILSKIIEIGTIFRARTITSINDKRKLINYYWKFYYYFL